MKKIIVVGLCVYSIAQIAICIHGVVQVRKIQNSLKHIKHEKVDLNSKSAVWTEKTL